MKRWQFILMAVAACAMSSSYAYSIRPEPPQPQKVYVYVPVCNALPMKGHKPHAATIPHIKLSQVQP